MSKYNSYAKRADEIARGLFEKYIKAEKDFKDAEDFYKANKRPDIGVWNADAEKIVRAAEAEGRYYRAKAAFESARKALVAGKDEIHAIAGELKAAIDADTRINPADLDMATVEILKSGVLRPEEYRDLVERNANNPTMARMIGSYAAQRAETTTNHQERIMLLNAVEASKQMDGSDYLDSFNGLCVIYEKTAGNPMMIGHWDELTSNKVQNF